MRHLRATGSRHLHRDGQAVLDSPHRTTAAGHPATLKAMVWLKPRKLSSRTDSP